MKTTFEVFANGTSYGDYQAADSSEALEVLARDAGYESFDAMRLIYEKPVSEEEFAAQFKALEIQEPEEVAHEVVKLVVGFADVDVVNGSTDHFYITASDETSVFELEVVRGHRKLTGDYEIHMEIEIDGIVYQAYANERLRDIAE